MTDIVCRYGGDEFCIALPACRLEDAVARVEQLAAALPDGCTISAGVAAWDGEETRLELFRRVDGALYDAKRTGGGYVTASSSAYVVGT